MPSAPGMNHINNIRVEYRSAPSSAWVLTNQTLGPWVWIPRGTNLYPYSLCCAVPCYGPLPSSVHGVLPNVIISFAPPPVTLELSCCHYSTNIRECAHSTTGSGVRWEWSLWQNKFNVFYCPPISSTMTAGPVFGLVHLQCWSKGVAYVTCPLVFHAFGNVGVRVQHAYDRTFG